MFGREREWRTAGLVVALCSAVMVCGCRKQSSEFGLGEDGAMGLMEDICLKESVCTGRSVNFCYGQVENESDGFLLMEAHLKFAQCVASANDCSEFEGCEKGAWDVGGRTCPDDAEELYCDQSSNELWWCYGGGGEQPAVYAPLDDYDMTCYGQDAFGDTGSDECGDYTNRHCDGNLIVDCWTGYTTTWDCTLLDPDFTCYGDDQLWCGIPEEQGGCAENNYNNYGDSGSCDGSVAEICIYGKTYRVDCSKFKDATCVETEYSAHCVAEGITPEDLSG